MHALMQRSGLRSGMSLCRRGVSVSLLEPDVNYLSGDQSDMIIRTSTIIIVLTLNISVVSRCSLSSFWAIALAFPVRVRACEVIFLYLLRMISISNVFYGQHVGRATANYLWIIFFLHNPFEGNVDPIP